MDNFVQTTPGIKKLVEYLKDLKPFEHLDIKVAENGEIDTFIVVRTTKVLIKAGLIKYIK